MNKKIAFTIVLLVIGASLIIYLTSSRNSDSIKLAISPYQDLAMIVAKDEAIGLDASSKIELITLPWEEILPSIASAGPTVDVGFGSLVEYLTKYPQLNDEQSDPVLFCYPAYVFKGGAFVANDQSIPELSQDNIDDVESIRRFLSYRIGAQKNSIYEMMLFSLAKKAGTDLRDLKITDISLNDGVLAVDGGSLDLAAAGLTQRTASLRKGGRVVLSMETLGFADVTGFICRKSVLDQREADVRNIIETWFKCVDYVYSDMDKNSALPLLYLKNNAAIKYTFEEYKVALSEEYFPRSINESEKELVTEGGKFSVPRISQEVSDYLEVMGIAKEPVPPPVMLQFPRQ
jgi:ABC-type amino acid transport substrate-binding protein